MKKFRIFICLFAVLFLTSCVRKEKLKISASFDEFTTLVNITLFGISPNDTSKAADAMEKSRNILSYFNREMNSYDENSSISVLNRTVPGNKTPVPESLREILEVSRNIHEYTDGAFDIAILPLADLWRESIISSKSVPSSAEIENILPFSRLDCYIFEDDSVTVRDSRCRIGLAGIAKGYAVDSVASYLNGQGFTDFIVEAGGDLTVFSPKKKAVGIKHPRNEGKLIDSIYISYGSVASSGDYEKFIIHDGQRYSHIINPATGYGISDCIAATVISEKAYLSDAFATAAVVMGKERARTLIKDNKLSGIIYFLDENGQVASYKINMSAYEKNETEGIR
ncbi:MAG: FAD:protein FMN transferase [Candidatus Delongbacteria bacterium]|nr:FAD:protein FMN transferase [Candidatus Delongbacteria bacterium]